MGVLLLLLPTIITCPILPAIISDLMKIVQRYLENNKYASGTRVLLWSILIIFISSMFLNGK